MYITETQELSLRREMAPTLKRLKINPSAFDVHTLEHDDLHDKKNGLIKAARSMIDRTPDKANSEDAKSIERAHEAMLEIIDELQGEIDIRHKSGDKSARSHSGVRGNPNAGLELECNGVADDDDGYESSTENRLKLIKPNQRFSGSVNSESRNSLPVGQYLRAMVTGATTDAERRALAGGTDSAGGYTVPEVLSNQLIDGLRASSVAIQAGAMTTPLTSDQNHIAKVASYPVPLWRAELGAVAESDPTFTRVTFAPKSLAVLVKVSQEIMEDSLNIATKLPEIIQAAMARELDRVIFMGTGTGNQPAGLNVISDVQTIAIDDTVANAGYSSLLSARKALKNQNVAGMSAVVMHPDIESEFGGLVDTTGQPLNYPSILDRPTPLNMLTTTQIPTDLGTGSDESTIFCGDFSHLIIGIRNEIRIEILKERFADTLEYGFLAYMRADVVAVHPEAFVKLTGVQQ